MKTTDIASSRTEKIAAIRRLPTELDAAIAGLSDSQLDTPYRDGGWTPRQVVHHIADSHMNAFVRMKLILTEDHPTFKPYDENAWAAMKDYQRPVASSVAIIDGLQERMADMLSEASLEDWSRTAHHPDNGEMSLEDLLNLYTDHGSHHVQQITGLRERMGW